MNTTKADIRLHLLRAIRSGENGIAIGVATRFGVTRQTVATHLGKLDTEGAIVSEGRGRGRRYRLAHIDEGRWSFPLSNLREDVVWRTTVAPRLAGLPSPARDVWHYGLTEMVNNAVDHSEGTTVTVSLARTALDATVRIADDGEGIFHRIQRLLDLYDPREAILELAKGKLTTDPARHSGEGIFFTSRVFDRFVLRSRTLAFTHGTSPDDWLIEEDEDVAGTTVVLTLADNCARTTREVMNLYAEPDAFSFDRTIVPVRLARHEGEKLVSRSQAKRLVARFERFRTVVLDFTGVEEIGQAFADEIFRVFASAHPAVTLSTTGATPEVEAMVARAKGA